jgi:predicted neutral ceramidase superfamily lipid hydrolase
MFVCIMCVHIIKTLSILICLYKAYQHIDCIVCLFFIVVVLFFFFFIMQSYHRKKKGESHIDCFSFFIHCAAHRLWKVLVALR